MSSRSAMQPCRLQAEEQQRELSAAVSRRRGGNEAATVPQAIAGTHRAGRRSSQQRELARANCSHRSPGTARRLCRRVSGPTARVTCVHRADSFITLHIMTRLPALMAAEGGNTSLYPKTSTKQPKMTDLIPPRAGPSQLCLGCK